MFKSSEKHACREQVTWGPSSVYRARACLFLFCSGVAFESILVEFQGCCQRRNYWASFRKAWLKYFVLSRGFELCFQQWIEISRSFERQGIFNCSDNEACSRDLYTFRPVVLYWSFLKWLHSFTSHSTLSSFFRWIKSYHSWVVLSRS